MKRLGVWTLAVAVVAVAAGPVAAQRPGGGFGFGGGGMLFLAGQKSVQEELKMTDEQVTKVKDLAAKQFESFGGLRDLSREEARKKMEELGKANTKAVAEILKPEQLKRLKQISWQRDGTRALANEEVADALKLSAEQKDKIKTIQEDAGKAMGELFTGGGNREERQKKREELLKATDEKMNAVLTDEQKTKLKELTGEPFKGTIEFRRPGGGQGGQGRRGRPGADQPKTEPNKG